VASPALQYFSTLSHETARFLKKKVTKKKMCFLIFSTTFCLEHFYCKKNWTRYDKKCTLFIMCSTAVILVRLQWNLNFLDSFSKKYSNIKFHQNPSSWSRVVTCGRMDGRTDITNLIVALRHLANAPKMVKVMMINVRICRVR